LREEREREKVFSVIRKEETVPDCFTEKDGKIMFFRNLEL
jgi:hypothetical protein